MSVRVDLLPESIRRREQERAANVWLAAGVGVFVLLLVLVWAVEQAGVDRAVERRDLALQEVAQLQAQVDALAAFQELADDLAAGNQLLVTAMGTEIAVARVLNDVALSLPSTSSLTGLTLAREAVPGAEPAPATDAAEVDLGESVANLLLSGYSIERFAPGVEGVLLEFDQVEGLVLTYLNTAAVADIESVEVTSFDANGLLTDRIYTGRYATGLPELLQ